MTTSEIEKRLSALEVEVANLKSSKKSQDHWWDKIAGTFAGNPRFEEAMRLGRESDSGGRGNGRRPHRHRGTKRKAGK